MHLLDGFFRSPSVETIFSDTATVQSILDFEAALARAEARAGIIPASAADVIVSFCKADKFDLDSLVQSMPAAGNLAIPLLKQLNALVAQSSSDAARYVHFGATSQDALDSGLTLQLRDAARVIDSDLESIIRTLASLSEAHRGTLLVARTWLQHALPTTFGYVTAGWLDAFLQRRDRLASLRDQVLVLQFGGAAGTLAALHNRGKEVAALLALELSIPLPVIPWHAQRERIAEMAACFGLMAGSSAKIARDLSLYMQTELAELSEPPAAGRGSSSTMPHKRNPVACAAITASSCRVPALVATVLSNLAGEHQRSVGAWQSEWEVLPEIARLTAGALHHLADLLPHLIIHSDKMRSNLELTKGLIYAEAVSIALSEKLDRASAHKLVEEACRRAQSENRHLLSVLSEDSAVKSVLSSKEIDSLFEPSKYLGSSSVFIDAVLAAAHKDLGHTPAKG